MTVEEALAHPYLKSLHDPRDEPTASGEFDWEFENIDSLPELQDLVLKEVLTFHSDPRTTAPIET